ncbi:MAG: RT0821/Lpp0805 family surface protein [Gammaproteobacteria bacterium]
MKKVLTALVSSVCLVSLVGCANMSNQDMGVLTGGAIGAALGSQFGGGSGKILAAAGGAIAGAYIGGAIGKSMDKVDRMQMSQAIESNKTGQTKTWHNPDTGNTYSVTPTKTYQRNDQPCRDYTTKAIIGGKTETIYGHACRMADGTWQVVN